MYCPIFEPLWFVSMRFRETSKGSAENWRLRWSTGRSSKVLYAVQVFPGGTLQTLLKLLANLATASGIARPSENARKPLSWNEKQRTLTSPPPDQPSSNNPRRADRAAG